MAFTNNGTTGYETFGTTSAVTGSAPSGATDGQPLEDLDAITVVVDTATGVTLSGAGSLLCYVYDGSTALWSRLPQADFSVGTSGVRSLAFAAADVTAPRNARIKWVPSGVTFSAGSAGVTVYQLGYSKSLRGLYA